VLPGAIAKVNKFFLVYCLIGVLKMLYEHASCSHLEELEAIMNSCDASILDEIPDEIARLSTLIVMRWWAFHGLPYVMDVFHVVTKVSICYMLRCLEILGSNFYFCVLIVGGECWRRWITSCWRRGRSILTP
jgi:hypothetical protein